MKKRTNRWIVLLLVFSLLVGMMPSKHVSAGASIVVEFETLDGVTQDGVGYRMYRDANLLYRRNGTECVIDSNHRRSEVSIYEKF